MSAEIVLGFDFGRTRVGIALGNTLTRAARPLGTIAAAGTAERFAAIAAYLRQWHPDRLVVGLPLDADGGDTPMTPHARRFGARLMGRFGLPVEFVDERHTSAVAEHALKPRGPADKAAIDAAAAALILQAWLDRFP
ncbi:MAG: Holliday junction resolvase RuvX [Burkholderiales bacterium]|nr:Holliday junction resolvase RuvX [Burkholderiales bacterium]